MTSSRGEIRQNRKWFGRIQCCGVYIEYKSWNMNITCFNKLTGNKELCVRLGLSCSAASEALEYSSISGLHLAHRQPGCSGDLVARVGQFGKRHGVLIPLDPGLGHAYTCACAWETKTQRETFFNFLNNKAADLTAEQTPTPTKTAALNLFSLLSALSL